MDLSFESFLLVLSSSTNNIQRDARIRRCLHPNQSECSGGIVKAHAIQNNRVLKKLAVDGMVVLLDGVSHGFFQDSIEKGRKIATTFTGFCSFHDKKVFQPIEDIEFSGTAQQVFLYSYRTFSWHFQKKQEAIMQQKIIAERMLSQGYDLFASEDYSNTIMAQLVGNNDNVHEKALFDDALLKENYSCVNSCIWEIPYEVSFAVSMMYELNYDILGNEINELDSEKPLKHIYLNIFPASGRSYCVWSWLHHCDDVYAPFAKQFMDMSEANRMNYLNNYLPIWTDAIVLSPLLVKKWGEEIMNSFIESANMTIFIETFEREDGGEPFSYMETPWDLFVKLF